VNLLVQSSNDAARTLLKAHKVRSEDLPSVETMRDEAADCLHRHLVTVMEEEARRREFDALSGFSAMTFSAMTIYPDSRLSGKAVN
jgi:hypothetical protein